MKVKSNDDEQLYLIDKDGKPIVYKEDENKTNFDDDTVLLF